MKAQDYISSGLLEAYVLGGLPAAEMEQVAGAMCRFPEVKNEVEAIEAMVIAAGEKEAVPPPADMEEQIWAAILANEQTPKAIATDDNLALSLPESFTESTTAKLIPLNTAGRSGGMAWARAAIWLALAGSVVTNYMLWSGKISDEKQVARLQQTVDTMSGRQQSLATILSRYQREAEMTAQPGVQPVAMLSTQPGHPMAATIYWNKAAHNAYVSVQKLPPPPTGMQYQMWAIAGGKPVSLGMLENEVAMNGGMQKVPEAVMDGQAFAVSLEKAGGNVTPTTDKIFLLGKMPV